MRIKGLIFLCLIVFLGVSCEPVDTGFSAEELRAIDSLYQLKVDSLEQRSKQICDSVFLADFDAAVDSLIGVRRREIMDIITE